MEDNTSLVKIRKFDQKVHISPPVTVFIKENNGRLLCRVPSFNWSFDAIDDDDIAIIVKALNKAFLNYYLIDKPKSSLMSLDGDYSTNK